MLLRYARASRGDDWAAEGSKEPVALLDSLQRNACAVPAAQAQHEPRSHAHRSRTVRRASTVRAGSERCFRHRILCSWYYIQ